MKLGKLSSFRARQVALRYGNPSRSLHVIAVTGEYGRSTTALLLAATLRAAGVQVAVFTDVSSAINDIPYTPAVFDSARSVQAALAAARKQGVNYVVLEMTGSATQTAVLPTIEIQSLLALTTDELSTQLQELPTCEYAVLPYAADKPATAIDSHKIIYFGEEAGADAYLSSYRELRGGTELTVTLDHHNEHQFATYLIGRANARNVTAAVAMAYIIGSAVEDFADGIAELETVAGNYQRLDSARPYRIVVDRAACRTSLELVVATAHTLKKRRLLVTLGRDFGDDDIAYVKTLADQVTVYGSAPADGIVMHEASIENAIRTSLRGAKLDDTVLFVGREFAPSATSSPVVTALTEE